MRAGEGQKLAPSPRRDGERGQRAFGLAVLPPEGMNETRERDWSGQQHFRGGGTRVANPQGLCELLMEVKRALSRFGRSTRTRVGQLRGVSSHVGAQGFEACFDGERVGLAEVRSGAQTLGPE
jgi:hypothetical protein